MRCIQGSISYSPLFVPAMELMPDFDLCISFFVIYCQLNLYCVKTSLFFNLVHLVYNQVSHSDMVSFETWAIYAGFFFQQL